MKRIIIVVVVGIIMSSCNHKTDDAKKTLEDGKIELGSINYIPANQELFDTIVELDKKQWDAYNKGDVNTLIDFMTDDHEFYHDVAGADFGFETNAEAWRRFFTKDHGTVGETVEGSNEVHEIPGYGALQISYQRFYDKEDPNWSKPARAIVLWKETPNGWLQSRVFSLHSNE
jgi:ketosteroid isomerase-like protein